MSTHKDEMLPVEVIEVGAMRYRVVRDALALKRRGDMTSEVIEAYCDSTEGVICLPEMGAVLHEKELSMDFLRRLMVHELTHAIFRNYGQNTAPSEVEETVCVVMESALIPILRRNPELFKWLSA